MKVAKKTKSASRHCASEFVEALAGRLYPDEERRDRAGLAALRRGLSGEQRDLVRVYPIVLPLVPHVASAGQHQAYVHTACLFGLYPTRRDAYSADRQPLGLARALRREWEAQEQQGSIQPRFMALLQSHADDLLGHLRQAVSIVAGQEHSAPLRWDDVLEALLWWPSPTGRVQQRWAREFWGMAGGLERDDEGESK